MEDIQKALEDVLKTERAGIQKKVEAIDQKAKAGSGDLSPETLEKIVQALKDRAAQNLEKTG